MRAVTLDELAARTAVRRLAVARVISETGTWAATTALMYDLLHRTGSAYWVTGAFLATFGTAGALSPLGGALADRFDRRRVMVASDVAAAAAFLALAAAPSAPTLLALALLATVAETPFLSASQAAIPSLVGPEQLSWANGLVQTSLSIALLVGPIVGGALTGSVGAPAVFAANAATFAVSAALVLTVRRPFVRARPDAHEHRGAGAGLRFVAADPVLRILLVAMTLTSAAFGVTLVADVPLASAFGQGALGYGLITASWGAAAVIGTRVGTRVSQARELAAIAGGTIIMGICLGLIAAAPMFALVLALNFVGGLGFGYAAVPEQSIVQRRAPDAVASRVFGIIETATLASLSIGFIAGGVIDQAGGARAPYAVSGGLLVAACAVLLRFRRTAEP